jgi:hypothetical protein
MLGRQAGALLLEPLCQTFFVLHILDIRAICWLRTMILLISASLVARITGVSYWRPAGGVFVCPTFCAQDGWSWGLKQPGALPCAVTVSMCLTPCWLHTAGSKHCLPLPTRLTGAPGAHQDPYFSIKFPQPVPLQS